MVAADSFRCGIFPIGLATASEKGRFKVAHYRRRAILCLRLIPTVASLPMYAWLFHRYSAVGLAIASDVGILAHTVALVALLHRKRLVLVSDLNWSELSKSGITAAVAAMLAIFVGRAVAIDGSRRADFASLALISLTWAAAVAGGLWLMRSSLLQELRIGREVYSPVTPPPYPPV